MWRKKFLCSAAQGNIDLTYNYWMGTMKETENEEGCRQPRSVTVQHEWRHTKGCLVQWLLPQTLCCYRLSEIKLEEINCFHWIKKKNNVNFQLFSWKSSQFMAEPFNQNSFVCIFLFTCSDSIVLDATSVTLFKEAKTDKHTKKTPFQQQGLF